MFFNKTFLYVLHSIIGLYIGTTNNTPSECFCCILCEYMYYIDCLFLLSPWRILSSDLVAFEPDELRIFSVTFPFKIFFIEAWTATCVEKQ